MMKKTLMIALLCLPLAMMAQERGGAVSRPGSGGNQLAGEPERTLTAEVVVKTVNGRQSCVIMLGTAPEVTYANDKFMMAKWKELTSSRFTNLVDALNSLTQLGFEIETSYAVMMAGTQETHIFLSKPGYAGRAVREGAAVDGAKGAPEPKASKKKKK